MGAIVWFWSGGGRGGAYSFDACISNSAIDYASLSRQWRGRGAASGVFGKGGSLERVPWREELQSSAVEAGTQHSRTPPILKTAAGRGTSRPSKGGKQYSKPTFFII